MTRSREGAGMGLHVVRRLVEVSGGRLAMTSAAGEVVVEVNLRAAVVEVPEARPPLAVSQPRESADGGSTASSA